MLGEADALLRHAIEAGRADEFLAVAAEVTVAEIVGEEIDDVGWAAGDRGGRGGGRGE